MLTWSRIVIVFAAVLAGGGALYVRLRWHRSPQAYRAMFALAACYFVAGVLLGAWVMHLATPTLSSVSRLPRSHIAAALRAPAL
jgi:hypothetical protein